MEHVVEITRDSRLGKHIPHVDEQRQGQQRIPVQKDKARVERHLRAAFPPQKQGEEGGYAADGAEDTLSGEQHEHHQREDQQRNQFMTHGIVSPLAFARSLKKVAITCNSISAIPIAMMILIGARGGDHGV